MNTPNAIVITGPPNAPVSLMEIKRAKFKRGYVNNYKQLVAFHSQAINFCKCLLLGSPHIEKLDELFGTMRKDALRKYRKDMSAYNRTIRKKKEKI